MISKFMKDYCITRRELIGWSLFILWCGVMLYSCFVGIPNQNRREEQARQEYMQYRSQLSYPLYSLSIYSDKTVVVMEGRTVNVLPSYLTIKYSPTEHPTVTYYEQKGWSGFLMFKMDYTHATVTFKDQDQYNQFVKHF